MITTTVIPQNTKRSDETVGGVEYQTFSNALTGLLTFNFMNFLDFANTLAIGDARRRLYSASVDIAIDFSGRSGSTTEERTSFQFDSLDQFP